MKFQKWHLLIASMLAVLVQNRISLAQTEITVVSNAPVITFPRNVSFSAHIASSSEIESVVLEYGVDKRTCGSVTARAFPDFKPSTTIDVNWVWEMLKSGSEPAGTKIWYQWQVTDKHGNISTSPKQEVIWLDTEHAWVSRSRDNIIIHWYDEPSDFSATLLDSIIGSLQQLKDTTGVTPQSPIDVYIYKGTADLQSAVLYEPGWTGGLAFPDYNIVLIGIGPEDLSWGRGAATHEITHILVGHLTSGCLVNIPTWLNEGIAVYAQGGPNSDSNAMFSFALGKDELLSLRSLSGSFSEGAVKADLSYSESYSIVNYMIATYGKEKLLQLFKNLRDSNTINVALQDAYGFDLETLETKWRASIGAPVHGITGETPTAIPSPTFVPTYPPFQPGY